MMNVVRPYHQVVQRGADLGLGLGVHRRGGVVQDQDTGILEQRAGDGDALLLPSREGDALFPDQRVVAIGEGEDAVVDGSCPGGGLDLGIGDLPAYAVGDILADGSREEERLLLDDADLLAQEVARVVVKLDAIEGQAAAGVLVEAGQQVDQGRLAGTGGTQQGNDLARLAVEADLLQRRAVLIVLEADILEDDVTLHIVGRRVRAFGQRLSIFTDDLFHSAKGYQAGGHLHDQAAQVAHGPDKPDDQARIGQVGRPL